MQAHVPLDRHARPRAPGVLAPGAQRAGHRSARARDQRPATRCSSTGLRETARPSSPRRFRSCSTATSAIPHALEVEGADHPASSTRSMHERSTMPEHRLGARSPAIGHDRRWVRCRRPLVMVGGELTLESLELSYTPATGFYNAPVQAARQRRRAGHRRLRPAAVPAARPAEPLDRAAREPRRLPDAQTGPEIRAAVHACSSSSPPTSGPRSSWTRRSSAASTTRCSARARRPRTSRRSSATTAREQGLTFDRGAGRGPARRVLQAAQASRCAAAIRAT